MPMYLNGYTVKMSFEGKNLYGQYINYSEKKNGPRASSAPILGLFSITFVYTADLR